MKLGIFIGSFNPIHIGHIKVMDYLISNNYVDKIVIVPTGSYWDKKIDVSLEDRLNMIKLLQKDYLIVEDQLNNTLYTYELLNKLQIKYPNDKLYLVISADNIISFDQWNNYQEILKYKIIVLNRDNINIKEYTNRFNCDNFIIVQEFNFIDISSTQIRDNVDNKYLDNNVFEYIKARKLYK